MLFAHKTGERSEGKVVSEILKGHRQNLSLYLPKYIVYPQWCVGMLLIHLFLHTSWFNTSSMLFAVLHHDKLIAWSLASS